MRTRANKDSTEPTKESYKTPLTSKKRDVPTVSTIQQFICSVCKKSSKCSRSNNPDAGGVAKTNKAISECMSKIDSLNLNFQEILGVNRDKPESQFSILTKLEENVLAISEKTKMIQESIAKHEVLLQAIDKSIATLKTETTHSHDKSNLPELSTESKGTFSVGLHNERIVNTIPPLASNPTSHIEHYERGFLTEELRTSACKYLNNCKNFVNKGTRQTLFFSQNADTLAPIAAIINHVNEKFEIHDNNKINSVTVTKYCGPKTQQPAHSDSESSISPDSHLFEISLGDTCPLTFIDKCTGNQIDVTVEDNSIFSMSYNSQLSWTRNSTKPVISSSSVRYSITLKSISRRNRNSTIIIGDSNTHFVKFYYEDKRSDLGKDIYGRRVTVYTIDDISPACAIGFQNVYIQVGLNNLNKFNLPDGSIDIEGIIDRWLSKVISIKQLCPTSRIIAAPIPPTKLRSLNDRARKFNAMLFSCRNQFWSNIGFNCLLDDKSDLLDSNFGRQINLSTGYRDRIHLGRRGISRLSLLIRDAVLQSRSQVDNRSYSAVSNGCSPAHSIRAAT